MGERKCRLSSGDKRRERQIRKLWTTLFNLTRNGPHTQFSRPRIPSQPQWDRMVSGSEPLQRAVPAARQRAAPVPSPSWAGAHLFAGRSLLRARHSAWMRGEDRRSHVRQHTFAFVAAIPLARPSTSSIAILCVNAAVLKHRVARAVHPSDNHLGSLLWRLVGS